jgi:hypothetical protein
MHRQRVGCWRSHWWWRTSTGGPRRRASGWIGRHSETGCIAATARGLRAHEPSGRASAVKARPRADGGTGVVAGGRPTALTGIPSRGSPFQRASDSSTSRPAPRSSSPPSAAGRSLTGPFVNRHVEALRELDSFMESDAAPSENTRNSSPQAPHSTGGPKLTAPIDQPNPVSHQSSIASSSSISKAMMSRPLSQNAGSEASRPKGASSAL